MLPLLLVFRNLWRAVRHAVREEDFAPALLTAGSLVLLGTVAYALGEGWNVIDSLYFSVSTLTTANVNDPDLILDSRSMKVFTIFYQLIGIGILVEILRRLGTSYVAIRAAGDGEPVG